MDLQFDPSLPVEAATTPPAWWYTDPRMHDSELREVFQRSWIAVGRTDQVSEPGAYFTGVLAENPYVVLCDEAGELRAFHNVCRHHAAVVAQECGKARELVCPYHGWTYRLDGSLRSAPRMGRLEGFNPKAFGLPPISVRAWGPLVLVDMDGPEGGDDNPRDLAADAAPLVGPLEELGFERMRWVERRRYAMRCNWKVFVDNSLDGGYHVAYAHERLAEGLAFDGYRTEVFDRSAIQVCESSGADARLGQRVVYAWLYPNRFVNRYGRMMDTNVVLPVAPDRCEVVFDFYVDDEDHLEWGAKRRIRRAVADSHVIQQEDVEICESTQRGLTSSSFDRGRYSSQLEGAVHAFHRMLHRDLAGPMRSDE